METTDFTKLAEILQKKKDKGTKEYHFRPYAIDGVFCYIVLYIKFSLLTVESVNVKCKFKYEGNVYNQPYVLYHHKYKSFKEALQTVQKITTKYKILNGDLESPENYEELKLEKCVLPYGENEKCSVCYEDTTDTTICNHAICLNCREKCILQQQLNCPICRNENIMHLYNNTMQLFNNRDSHDVNRVLVNNPDKYGVFEEDDTDEDENDNNSSSSEEDEDASEPMQVDNDQVIVLVNDISEQI